MAAREVPISLDDALFALTLWKYFAAYVLVRISIHGAQQIRALILGLIGSCAIVAVLGLVQVSRPGALSGFFGLFVAEDDQDKLSQYNAKSTIGASIPFGDVMSLTACLCLALFALAPTRKRRLGWGLATAFFSLSAVASGQVSGVLALLIALGVGAWLSRSWRQVAISALPFALGAYVLARPALEGRLASVDPATGLPSQWTGPNGRIANLRTFIFPRLGEQSDWLFGVQTSARIPAPEPWREWIWIESGYVWLLWNGGLPLLMAFLAYVLLAIRASRGLVYRAEDRYTAAVGVASFSGLVMLASLMILDPHLTMRGSADVLFSLVAVAVTAGRTKEVAGHWMVGALGRRAVERAPA
ncbi:hypothetical protein [Modestobacter sp. SYSU DS0875]